MNDSALIESGQAALDRIITESMRVDPTPEERVATTPHPEGDEPAFFLLMIGVLIIAAATAARGRRQQGHPSPRQAQRISE